jgi:hypothetical protein
MNWSEEEYQEYCRRISFERASALAGAGKAPEAPAPLPPAEREDAFLAWVLGSAKAQGWMGYHTHDSRRSEAGFPDLVLVREHVLFAELKSATGKLTSAQATWLSLLTHAGLEAVVWRPADKPVIAARLAYRQSAGKAPCSPVPVPVRVVHDALDAVHAEAARRGRLFPQTRDEQDKDTLAVRRVRRMLEFYEGNTGCANLYAWPNVPGCT